MLGIGALICFLSFKPVKPPGRTFWDERLKIGVSRRAKKRLLTLWTAHGLGRARQAVRWRCPLGMGDIRVPHRSNWHAARMTLLPPRHDPRQSKEPLPVWVIRVWEEQATAGEEPLEWLLLTSVKTTTLEDAWERVDWYRSRWLVEDYHQCLKSGCRIEERQLQSVDGLMRLLGLLSPLAVRLLQVRAYARAEKEASGT
jgi:hypothetical protein